MSVSDRDRKLLLILVPIAVLVAYWFLLLSPKRQEASKASQELTKQEKAREDAQARAAQLQNAKSTFATDYAALVRLGKAIPSSVDMPSLIVQLQTAAKGTGIRFDKIAQGADQPASSSTTPAPSGSSSSSSGSSPSGSTGSSTTNASGSGSSSSGTQPGGNAQAGGPTAGTGYGGATEAANNAQAKGSADAAKTSGVDATTSSSSKKGLPVGGGSASSPPGTPGSAPACAAGLQCVPLDFEFRGSFFDLANFFHSLKRFVRVVNDRVSVKGRLLSVDRFKFSTQDTSFPNLKAEVSATIYLSPKTEGPTSGASPQGPAPSSGQSTPASGGSNSSPATTPTATAIK